MAAMKRVILIIRSIISIFSIVGANLFALFNSYGANKFAPTVWYSAITISGLI